MSQKNTRLHINIKDSQSLFAFLGVALFCLILLRNLWIGDDAFITLRVVDNWVHGYGLRWNISERVQVFTHPLWLFLLTLFYLVKPDPFFTFYASSFIVSGIAIFLLFRGFSPSFQTTLLGTWLLIGSSAFLDYSSSGLENPLTHLLLLIYLYISLNKSQEPSLRRLFWMSLLAGLAALNRLDTLLFYLPLLVYTCYELRRQWVKAGMMLFTGFLPILLWELFSLIYYGFLFPNTYPAKLNTALPASKFILHGFFYIFNSLEFDPVTLTVVLLAMFVTFSKGDRLKKLALTGGMLYFVYIIWIGGDFMMGRFYSALFLLSIVLLLKSDLHKLLNLDDAFSFGLASLVVFVLGINNNYPPIMIQADSRVSVLQNGIANEKLFYYFQSGWLNQVGHFTPPFFGGPEGLLARQAGKSPLFDTTIGAFGYYAGPEIYIIDSAALTDPLLARIPYSDFERPGHYIRTLPQGYVQSFVDGFNNEIENQALRMYYDKLAVITRGDLFTVERLKLIRDFNLGRYDYLMTRYLKETDLDH